MKARVREQTQAVTAVAPIDTVPVLVGQLLQPLLPSAALYQFTAQPTHAEPLNANPAAIELSQARTQQRKAYESRGNLSQQLRQLMQWPRLQDKLCMHCARCCSCSARCCT